MRHFCKIAEFDVVPLLNALATQSDLWNENTLRTSFAESPHSETDDIWVWFNRIPEDHQQIANDIECVPYRAWSDLPQIREIVFGLMARVGAVQLGRVLITRLPPGGTIPEHIDGGAPATFYTRYQVALQSLPGCSFHIADEVMNFRMGECWWIDNRSPHSVVNNSADDRLALVIDVRLA